VISRSKSILAAVALLALAGCGGSSVKNASHLRFFNALNGSEDVRVYVGDRLISGNNAGPAYGYGGDFGYAQAPSGSVDIVVNPYIDPTTTTASLATQTLVKDRNYTVVAMSLSGTATLRLYADSVVQSANTAYFRIIDAASVATPVYAILRDPVGNVVYQTSSTSPLTTGTNTGYRSYATDGTDSAQYTLDVYDGSDFANSIGSETVTLQPGGPVTIVLYDQKNGTGVSIKSGVDVYGAL